MTHTPGPWKYSMDRVLRVETGAIVAKISPTYGADRNERMEANARLIAAAPDLLAALSTLDSIERGMQGWHENAKAEAWAKARAALAKANGEA